MNGLLIIAVILAGGGVAGAAAMLLYRWSSNQQQIREMKAELARLRSRMLSPELSPREAMQLSMQNLKLSFKQLGRVTGPSLLSMIPVLLIATALQTLDPQPREILAVGPGWMRGWEFLYFASVFVVALALKSRLKIH